MEEQVISLNVAQKKVVSHDKGPLLVVAGAGTGKTTVIAARIANLIRFRGIRPSQILALTFTEKAASEMQQRVEGLLSLGEIESEISTFHSFGETILRSYAVDLGLSSDYQIISIFQQQVILNKVIDGLDITYHRPLGRPTSLLYGLIQFISRLKDDNILPKDFQDYLKTTSFDDLAEKQRLSELSQIYCAYQQYCENHNLLDYGDLLCMTYKLLCERPTVLKEFQDRYHYVLVDEYQDTNYIQAQILELLCKKHQNIMVVGDDDQSIYRFRGANISNILRFTKQYPSTKKVSLVHNYRSGQKILDAAYKLILHNNPYRLEEAEQIDKKLKGLSQGSNPVIMSFSAYHEELQSIADGIAKQHKSGTPYSEFAVLLRKNNQALDIVRVLEKNNIPYQLSESKKLFELEEVQNLLYFVRYICDEDDSQALYGLLTSEIYSLPLADITKCSALAARSHQPLASYIREKSNYPDLVNVVSKLDDYKSETSQLRAGELIYRYFELSGYLKILYNQSNQDNLAAIKLQNIATFFGFIRDYEQVSDDHTMYSLWLFLQSVLRAEAALEVEQTPLDVDAVQIMTVHRAKGLEFDFVFVPNLISRVFPAQRKNDVIRIPDGLFETKIDSQIDWHVHEERRLFYVAITRARKGLNLSWSQNHGGKQLRKPSMFIEEITGNVPASPVNSEESISNNISNFQVVKRVSYDPVKALIDKDGYLHLSVNQLVSFETSVEDFWYFEVLKMPKGPFHSLVYGSAVHAALEQYYQDLIDVRKPTISSMIKAFDGAWRSEGFVSLKHEQNRFQRGHEVIKQYFSSHSKSNEQILHVEKPFNLVLADIKLVVRGRYDAVFATENGVEIRDFKTSEVKDEKAAQKRVRDSLQLKIYSLAWQQLQNSTVERVSLLFVEESIVAAMPAPDSNKTLAKLGTIADNILSGEFRSKITDLRL
jgi:DNA helicase-2/ATP-dependent DNA helicase PcrA